MPGSIVMFQQNPGRWPHAKKCLQRKDLECFIFESVLRGWESTTFCKPQCILGQVQGRAYTAANPELKNTGRQKNRNQDGTLAATSQSGKLEWIWNEIRVRQQNNRKRNKMEWEKTKPWPCASERHDMLRNSGCKQHVVYRKHIHYKHYKQKIHPSVHFHLSGVGSYGQLETLYIASCSGCSQGSQRCFQTWYVVILGLCGPTPQFYGCWSHLKTSNKS